MEQIANLEKYVPTINFLVLKLLLKGVTLLFDENLVCYIDYTERWL